MTVFHGFKSYSGTPRSTLFGPIRLDSMLFILCDKLRSCNYQEEASFSTYNKPKAWKARADHVNMFNER